MTKPLILRSGNVARPLPPIGAPWRRWVGPPTGHFHITKRVSVAGARQTVRAAWVWVNGDGRQLRFLVYAPDDTYGSVDVYGRDGCKLHPCPNLQAALDRARPASAPHGAWSVCAGGLWDYTPESAAVVIDWCAERVAELWRRR